MGSAASLRAYSKQSNARLLSSATKQAMSRTPSQYVEVTVAFAPVAMPPILLHVAYYCVANTIISLAIHEHKKRLQFLGLPMTGPDAVREGTEDYVLLFADRMQRCVMRPVCHEAARIPPSHVMGTWQTRHYPITIVSVRHPHPHFVF